MEQAATGKHQNTRRMTNVMDSLANHAGTGLRLVDLVQETGFGKGTLHRIMAGLVEHQLVDHDADTGRYFIGMKVMNWAAAGRKRFGLTEQMKPVLQAICEQTEDTVYLTQRRGDEVWYIDRREGAYPLKALPVDVGAKRPLGVGAAPLAILAFDKPQEIDRIMGEYGKDRLAFGIDNELLATLVERAQSLGYALHDGEVLPEMIAIGVPVCGDDGRPFAAVSVAATRARMGRSRQREIADMMRAEIASSFVYA